MHTLRKANDEELWSHTRQPMKAPLLAKLQKDNELFDLAVVTFTIILKVVKYNYCIINICLKLFL